MRKLLVMLTVLVGTVLLAFPQKVPNIQGNSQWLPANSKIDGKLSEWDDVLQAYNRSTRLEYTIANDDNTLYLAFRSRDMTTTAKILAGGISFLLNRTSKNNANGASQITFPATNSTYTYSKDGWPTPNFRLLSDSADIENTFLQLKEIKVTGLKGINDTILSIYNEHGVKTKMSYTDHALICEISVPLDLFGLAPGGPAAFTYNIRLNGVPIPPPPPGTLKPPPPPMVVMVSEQKAPPCSYIIEKEIDYPTDFGGKYVLVKK